MFSAKQGHYWYHFYNVFGMTRSLTGDLTQGPPALEASTLPLGYRGGGICEVKLTPCVLIVSVLPKFEVTITPPSYLLPTSKTIAGKICAKYVRIMLSWLTLNKACTLKRLLALMSK